MLKRVYQLFINDIGIDLGTANTLVYVQGMGIVLSEPSVVAVQASSGKIVAVGGEAKRMLGRTPKDIVAIRPMKDGVIADFDTVEKMIRYFIRKINRSAKLIKPRMVIGVPSSITEVERRAVYESAERAGARDIHLVEEALAAALGANVPIQDPAGNIIVDIGGGTTEIAVISLGGLVITDSIRVGGDEVDEAIIRYLRISYNLVIGERMAETVKLTIGNAFPSKKVESMEFRGRDALNGLPKTIEVDSNEIRKAIHEPLKDILEAIKRTLERTPPELAADIVERGIILTGGGCLLKGLDKFLSRETGVPVFRAENPLTCVVLGTGKYLESMRDIRSNM